jgi:hypothetical protein
MMVARWFPAALVLLNLGSCVSVSSFQDDSHYVTRGPRTGYYIVRPGSALSQQLGIQAAPHDRYLQPIAPWLRS